MSALKTDAERVDWSRRYEAAMRRHLRSVKSGRLPAAANLGRQAAALGLETLDVARVHEQALITVTPVEDAPGNAGDKLLERADIFFKETIVQIEATHRAARKDGIRIDRLTRTLRQRAAESSASDEQLEQAIARREEVEASADARAARNDEILTEAQRIQKRLRDEMRGILSQNENEQKRIGGELRNEIAQALLAVDLSLLALRTSGSINTDKIEKGIAKAERILQELHRWGWPPDNRRDRA
jgi:signal transduction histidine kinase